MKNLWIFAGLVLIVVFAALGCNVDDNQQPLVTIEPTTPTQVPPVIEPTVVKVSLPCYTAADDQKVAIRKGLLTNLGAYRVELWTITLWIDEDGCIRGTFDWTMANDYVKDHPDTTADQISPTPFQQLAELEIEIGIPEGSLDRNVYWVSGIAPSKEVCDILSPTLRCY